VSLLFLGGLPVLAQDESLPVEPGEPLRSAEASSPGDGDLEDEVRTLERPVSNVFVINVHDIIDEVQLESIERRIDLARKAGAELLVFDLDTPGGELYAAFEIADLVFRTDDIPTVAFVSQEAISAGSLIALACDDLVMGSGTTLGDCEPIFATVDGIATAPEKIQTVIRAKFRAFAEKNGYPVLLSQALVTKDLEIVEVRDTATGEKRFEDRARIILSDDSDKGSGLPRGLEIVRVVVPAGELLTMTDSEALSLGFSRATVKSVDEAVAFFAVPRAAPVVLEFSWSETFARKLNAIKWLFLALGVLGLYLEIKTPGFGLPGILGILCMGIYFLSGYASGLAESWEIVLFFLGIVLIALEIFVIPGFGLPGIVGVLLVIVSLFLAAVPFAPLPLPEESSPAARGFQIKMMKMFLLQLASSLAFVIAFAYVLGRYLPKTPYLSRLILDPGPSGPVTTVLSATDEDSSPLPLGAMGEAITDLRPSGRARFGRRRFDVVTEGSYLAKGQAVRVLEIHGNRIVVGRTHEEE
jgi:membrane-bound serine protease (ClpP class)